MFHNINCKYNHHFWYCENEKVKKSLFGFGARLCKLADFDWKNYCEFQEEWERPLPTPRGQTGETK